MWPVFVSDRVQNSWLCVKKVKTCDWKEKADRLRSINDWVCVYEDRKQNEDVCVQYVDQDLEGNKKYKFIRREYGYQGQSTHYTKVFSIREDVVFEEEETATSIACMSLVDKKIVEWGNAIPHNSRNNQTLVYDAGVKVYIERQEDGVYRFLMKEGDSIKRSEKFYLE